MKMPLVKLMSIFNNIHNFNNYSFVNFKYLNNLIICTLEYLINKYCYIFVLLLKKIYLFVCCLEFSDIEMTNNL